MDNQYSIALKIDLLVAHFLQENKRLSLPGIGTFALEGGGFKFENQSDREIDPSFIEFVKTHTGKMSSLAKSDIESYIMLNRQFLNIGKQMFIEGVGTLVKSREGSLEFTAGAMPVERLEDTLPENRPVSAFEDKRYEPRSNGSRKGAIIGLAVLTIALIAAGVWYLNRQPDKPEEAAVVQPVADTAVTVADTGSHATLLDSLASHVNDSARQGTAVTVINGAAEEWNFIIVYSQNREYAQRRYAQLRELGKRVTLDSTAEGYARIYFRLPATAADTLRKRDSLARFYATRVRVEKP